MSILKNRKNFKDSKKTQKLVKIGKNLTLGDGGGVICWLARIYTRPLMVYQKIFEFACLSEE